MDQENRICWHSLSLSYQIQNFGLRFKIKDVREEAEKIDRDFIVIHWELQPNDVELSEYFYDQVETQLKKNYNISFEFKTEGVPDHKQNIRDVLGNNQEK